MNIYDSVCNLLGEKKKKIGAMLVTDVLDSLGKKLNKITF
jgi:hypothetical protein